MFGLGVGEITVILLIALIFIGPKRLPEVGKKVGALYRQLRDAADTVRSTIAEDIDETTEPSSEVTIKKDTQGEAKPHHHDVD